MRGNSSFNHWLAVYYRKESLTAAGPEDEEDGWEEEVEEYEWAGQSRRRRSFTSKSFKICVIRLIRHIENYRHERWR